MLTFCKHVSFLLVDDDRQFLAVMSEAINSEPGLHLTAVCSNKREALQVMGEAAFDIALVGLNLPDGSGLEVVEAARRCRPALDVLVMGNSDDKEALSSSIAAGAVGCLLKETVQRHSRSSTNSIVASVLFSHTLRSTLGASTNVFGAPDQLLGLSSVQKEILGCLARGLSNKEIARTLILSSYNVDYHLKRLRKRFSVHNRVQLVAAAMTVFQH